MKPTNSPDTPASSPRSPHRDDDEGARNATVVGRDAAGDEVTAPPPEDPRRPVRLNLSGLAAVVLGLVLIGLTTCVSEAPQRLGDSDVVVRAPRSASPAVPSPGLGQTGASEGTRAAPDAQRRSRQ